MKRFWFGRMIMFFILFVAAVFLFSTAVMLLWNAILPAVIGVKAISFYQALGILVLSKILFGFGRGGGWHRKRHAWKNNWREKWQNMTPEEREKFRGEWRNRCGGRWNMNEEGTAAESKTNEG